MDAISMLSNDHSKFRQMLGQLATKGFGNTDKKELIARIEREVKVHAKLEEEIFYPAFKDSVVNEEDRKLFFEAVEEHHVVDKILPELKGMDTDSDEFIAKATVVKELIEHHAEEEEKEMFQRARSLMGMEKLNELGRRMSERRTELEASWDNPVTKVLNKAQSVVEKVLPTGAKHAKIESNREENRR
jgi:hemerythrin-like domain-containing protein